MAAAVRRLANRGGGIVVVDGAEVLAELPLPVAGLLSDAPLDEVIAASREIVEAARSLGCTLEAPFQHLSFLALSVIPSLKLTDRGLVDVDRFELVPLAAQVILANCWVVTMDDAGTEHRSGWLQIEDGLVVATGSGAAARARRRSGRRSRHAGLRQHPPSPLPEPHARPRAGRRPVHLAEDAVPGVGPTRRRDGVRGCPRRAGRARAVGLLDGVRPPLRLPARRLGSRRGRAAGCARARAAVRRVAGLDGSRRVGRRSAAGFARRGSRHDPGRHRAAGRTGRRRPRADRRRAVLAVLGHDPPDGRVGRACAPAVAAAAHAPRGDARGGRVLPRAVPVHAGRIPRTGRLDRPRRVVRALRPSLRRDVGDVRSRRCGRRPLPDVQLATWRGGRAGARAARRGRARRARRRRHRFERARRPVLRGEAGAAAGTGSRRRWRAERARGAAARDARRRGRAAPRRHRLARARQARRRRDLADGRPRVRRRRRPRRESRPQRPPPGRHAARRGPAGCARAGRWWVPTCRRSQASTANRPDGYGRNDALDPRARHRARPPGRRCARRGSTTTRRSSGRA